MMKYFFPYDYVDCVQAIDYRKLYRMGYRGILFDIDNTLVHHGDDSTEEIDDMFRQIQEIGLKTVILSNNNEARILRFLKNIHSLYIYDAQKPNPEGYDRAIQLLGLEKNEVIMIGDQIFTDILGANRSGIASILVKFICLPEETNYGKRRSVEKLILKLYHRKYRSGSRLGNILKSGCRPISPKRKLFCELNPVCYQISVKKEQIRKRMRDAVKHERFASSYYWKLLPNSVFYYCTDMIKKGPGIDPTLQMNKAENIKLAAKSINGIMIYPGEVFSFWKCVGKLSRRRGFKDGRVIKGDQLVAGLGGGLCNLANALHILILHSPLEVTEFHSHSDALAPDHGVRVPFSSGTSVSYNQLDYRFKNTTGYVVQLSAWCENDVLRVELRSEKSFSWNYEITEEDHHFRKEGDKYYRVSKIYKNTFDKVTGDRIEKKLVLDNHSEVMFDYSLIPQEQIRN